MRRRSFLLGIGLIFLLAGGTTGVLAALVKQEPEEYRTATVPEGALRKQRSQEFQREASELYNGIKGLTEAVEWYAQFTQEQTNSYLAEDFITSHMDRQILPDGISQPRVVLQRERICLAFRYGSGFWSTVISIELRVWRGGQEPNVVAVELLGLRAGLLPVSSQWLLERISAAAQRQNIDLTWYRHEGNPVALLRFQSDQPRATVQLDRLDMQEGTLTIRGRTIEAGPVRASLGTPTPE